MKTALLLIALALASFALELSVEGNVEGVFDNREFPSLAGSSQTFYGIRPTLTMGLKIDEMSSLHFGVNHFFQFGQESGHGIVYPLMSYEFAYEPHFFVFGIAPRRDFVSIATFFISDGYDYQHQIFNGTYYQFSPSDRWKLALWLDWTGMRSTTQKEAFLLGAQAKYQGDKGLFIATDFMYNHTANKEGTTGDVQDYNGWTIDAGWQKKSGFKHIQLLNFGVTPSLRFSRDRSISKAYNTTIGLEEHAKILFRRFGFAYQHYNDLGGSPIRATLPSGESRYLEDMFDRIDVFFFPLGKVDTPVKISAMFSAIIADGELNHREKLMVTVPFSHVFKKSSNAKE